MSNQTNLSKSKYCAIWQCPKIAWLRKYMPDEAVVDEGVRSRMAEGSEVGDLAMGLFGDFVEIDTGGGDVPDITKMVAGTAAEMAKGTPVICEASVTYNGLYCAVDILRKTGDGWAIYEVKSSTKRRKDDGTYEDDKEIYVADIAYQKYVLDHCGVNVTGTFLVCLNGDYIFDGRLDLSKLFYISDVSGEVANEIAKIEPKVAEAGKLLASNIEPAVDLHENCNKPYPCAFWRHCTKHIPAQSVFDVYRIPFKKKIELYKKGRITFKALLASGELKNEKQRRQLEFAVGNRDDAYVNREEIAGFLNSLSYPLYFLDFETVQPVIPIYPGTRPYTQIPFQYSLHYIENEGGPLKHSEFLAVPGTDPRRALAEQLCADIPMNVCVTAYNKAFECTIIKRLADTFPDLSEHLLNIREHIFDLLVPFQSGFYYNRAMGNSFSIKSVLPALFPDDPGLDYHNLDQIHNGGEAMSVFPKLASMATEEREETRRNLLKYCELDTFAMVKVWEKLREAAGD